MSVICAISPNRSYWSKYFYQISSQVTKAMALYSPSALDLATTIYFLMFHDIKLLLMNTQYDNSKKIVRKTMSFYGDTDNSKQHIEEKGCKCCIPSMRAT